MNLITDTHTHHHRHKTKCYHMGHIQEHPRRKNIFSFLPPFLLHLPPQSLASLLQKNKLIDEACACEGMFCHAAAPPEEKRNLKLRHVLHSTLSTGCLLHAWEKKQFTEETSLERQGEVHSCLCLPAQFQAQAWHKGR